MRKEKEITVEEKKVMVRELTALQGQQIIDGLSKDEDSFIDMLFPDRIPASVVKMSTELKEDELLSYTPTEIEQIIDAVEELNPTLASLIKRLAELGMQVLAGKSEEQHAD